MLDNKLTREACIELLRNQYAHLKSKNENRYPQRSDFSDREVMAIKAFLGPWPRALEVAGVKPPKSENK